MDQSFCLGTRIVVLTGEQPSNIQERAPEGLLAVYNNQQQALDQRKDASSSEWPRLHLEIGTSHAVYRGEVDVAEFRPSDDLKKQATRFLLSDGNQHPNVTVNFHYSRDKSNRLDLIIQRRLTSGIKQYVYNGTLQSSTAETNKNKSSLLHFCHKLGNSLNESSHKIKTLEQEIHQNEKSIENWKETAQFLDKKVWQAEKDRLVNSFVKLWNERQTRAKKQLQDLREELEMCRKALSTNGTRKGGRALKLDDEIANAAGDDLAATEDPMPMEEMQALAAGRKQSSGTSTRSILNKRDTVSAATLKQQAEAYGKRKQEAETASLDSDSDSDTDDEQATALPKRQSAKSYSGGRNAKRSRSEKRMTKSDDIDNDTDGSATIEMETAGPAKKQARPIKKPLNSKQYGRHDNTHSKAKADEQNGRESPVILEHSDDEALRSKIQGAVKKWNTSLSSSDED